MMNFMEYKGYIGSINYDDEDGIFYGKVEGLKQSLILFEGHSVDELKKDFKEAIDNHLEYCKRENVEPEVQCKGSLNVRLGPQLHVKAKIKADEMNISINKLICEAVTKYLETV